MKQGELNVFLIAKYPVKVYFNGKQVMMYEFVFDICDKTDDLRPFVMATDFNDSGCGIFWIC